MPFTVLVTPRSLRKGLSRYSHLLDEYGLVARLPQAEGRLTEDDMAELIVGADAIVVGLEPVSRKVLEKADRLRVISKFGVGVDNIDLDAARERGITVTNTPSANCNAVAELAVGMMFALARRIAQQAWQVSQGNPAKISGVELAGRTLGLVGLGSIGTLVATKASKLGMTVLAYDPYVSPEKAASLNVTLTGLDELLSRADFVSLHCPLTPSTRGILGRRQLESMKSGSYLINTARGGLVDEDALAELLLRGHLAGAAVDDVTTEPITESPLLKLKNVIVTPHVGASTQEAIDAMSTEALKNAADVLRGIRPAHVVVG